MDSNRILVIGGGGTFRSSYFSSPPNLAEFGAVIWYPQSLKSEWEAGLASLTSKRMSELMAWVRQGHFLAIIGSPPHSFETSYSHAGKPHPVKPLQAEPFVGIEFEKKSGQLIEYCGPESFRENFDSILSRLQYDSVMKSTALSPLLKVSRGGRQGADQVVGGFKKIDSGTVAFLPALSRTDDPNLFDIYHLSIVDISDALGGPPTDLPKWAADFQTKDEVLAWKTIDKANEAISKLKLEIAESDSVRAAENLAKHLFVATGDSFANAVANALRQLGLHVIEGPRHRADIIAWDGTRLAAIEAKGLDGVAREGNLRQAERWTADVLATLSAGPDEIAADSDLIAYRDKLVELEKISDFRMGAVECKGIMIIGTHRNIPIDQRPESFPDPVARVIARSNVCALSGLQLFEFIMRTRSEPNAKAEILKRIFETNGIVDIGVGWTACLQKKPA